MRARGMPRRAIRRAQRAMRPLLRHKARAEVLAYIETLAGRRLRSVVLARDVPYKGGSDGD